MSDNFDEYPVSTANDEDILAVQDVPTLEKQKITILQIKNFVLNLVNKIIFNTEYVETGNEPIGTTFWDKINHTMKTILPYGSSLLDGQELLEPTYNDTGAEVPNGTAVFFSAPAGADEHLGIGLTRPDLFARVAGIVTSTHAIGGEGWTATYGVVHDMPLNGLTLGQPAFANPSVPGGMTNTDPTWPDHIIFMGSVIKDNGDGTGDFRVDPYIVQREVPTPVPLPYSSPSPARNAEENIHGGLVHLATAHDLNAGVLTFSAATGIGKMLIVVNSASPDCTITVNGTCVDRDTGAETADETSTIAVDTQTTDGTGTDVNGYEYHDFQNAYITDRWFTGIPLAAAENIVITGSGTTVPTSIDVYHISFEQFNDAKYVGLVTADMNYKVLTPDKMSAFIYTVEVTGDKVSLTKRGEHIRTAAQHVAGQMYRITRRNMGIELDGRTDGIYMTIHMNGNNQFADVGIKVWGNVLY